MDLFDFAKNNEMPFSSSDSSGSENPVRNTPVLNARGDARFLPLAERLRPQSLEEFVGLPASIKGALALDLSKGLLRSTILHGPPGSGKTSIMKMLKTAHHGPSIEVLASEVSVKDIREWRALRGNGSLLLFVDEIHRLSRVHQDALLPDLESQQIILLGASTENPGSFLAPAFMSRCRCWALTPLSRHSLLELGQRALASLRPALSALPGSASQISIEQDAISTLDKESTSGFLASDASKLLDFLIQRNAGDARKFLSELELASQFLSSNSATIKGSSQQAAFETLAQFLGEVGKSGRDFSSRQSHAISSLIKSMRSSQPKKAIGWLAYLLDLGADPLYVTRRLMIFASEDVGKADPGALGLSVQCHSALKEIGLPEGRIILSQTVLHLARAPKCREAYVSLESAIQWVKTKSEAEILRDLDINAGQQTL